jgi:hypothetical protein
MFFAMYEKMRDMKVQRSNGKLESVDVCYPFQLTHIEAAHKLLFYSRKDKKGLSLRALQWLETLILTA